MAGVTMMVSEAYERFKERYESGEVPWDDTLPPPEVRALVAQLTPGRALDLGCGYGRAAIYLAQHGWEVDGIDFVPQAIAGAVERARAAGVAARAHFHVASITDLHFLAGPYDLAVDVGSMHSLTQPQLRAYRDELTRLLPAGARYLLFAHIHDENQSEVEDTEEEERPRGIAETVIRSLFQQGFVLEHVEHGLTQVEDKPPWKSAWFWYRRV